jgi:FixJ family two-component response regulator
MTPMAARPVPRISIVDDDPSVRRALGRLVEVAGFDVQTYASGAQALDAGPSPDVACLVVDVYLGDMTGFELSRRLAARGLSAPTIFITAHDDAVTHEEARRAGAAAYFTKPVDGELLVDAINAAIRP